MLIYNNISYCWLAFLEDNFDTPACVVRRNAFRIPLCWGPTPACVVRRNAFRILFAGAPTPACVVRRSAYRIPLCLALIPACFVSKTDFASFMSANKIVEIIMEEKNQALEL